MTYTHPAHPVAGARRMIRADNGYRVGSCIRICREPGPQPLKQVGLPLSRGLIALYVRVLLKAAFGPRSEQTDLLLMFKSLDNPSKTILPTDNSTTVTQPDCRHVGSAELRHDPALVQRNSSKFLGGFGRDAGSNEIPLELGASRGGRCYGTFVTFHRNERRLTQSLADCTQQRFEDVGPARMHVNSSDEYQPADRHALQTTSTSSDHDPATLRRS